MTICVFPKTQQQRTSVADDVRCDAKHLSDDRKHPVVRNIETMTADTTGETEQCRLTVNTPLRFPLERHQPDLCRFFSDRRVHDADVERREHDERYVLQKNKKTIQT